MIYMKCCPTEMASGGDVLSLGRRVAACDWLVSEVLDAITKAVLRWIDSESQSEEEPG